MSRIHSFPPIENAGARILILGSMPGKESLRAGQYYAHPRNAFWPIMGSLIGAAPALPYQQRVHILQAAGIACGVVQDAEDMIEHDPQLAGRGALVTLPHPLLGPFGHIATPLRFSRDAFQPYRAPRMGEHVGEVASQICGLSPERIAELEEAGVFK